MLLDEINTFCEALQLPPMELGRDSTAQLPIDEHSEFFIDASQEKTVCLYLMASVPRASKQMFLKALSLCDLRKSMSHKIHCVADENDRIGFFVSTSAEEVTSDTLILIFQQLVQSQMRLLSSI